jgi:hypothetical protein
MPGARLPMRSTEVSCRRHGRQVIWLPQPQRPPNISTCNDRFANFNITRDNSLLHTAHPIVSGAMLVGMLLAGTPAFALNPTLDVSQYAHTAWKIRD